MTTAAKGAALKQPGRTQRRRERHRTRMLDIAEALFAAQPYATVRVDEVADLADVYVGTVYTHFGNKDGLYLAVAERILDRALDFVASAVTQADDHPVARLTATGEACLELVIASPSLARFLLSPTLPDDEAVHDRVATRVSVLYTALADVIRECIAGGHIASVDADDLASFLIASWCGVSIARTSPLTPPTDAEGARQIIDQASAILLRGLQAGRTPP